MNEAVRKDVVDYFQKRHRTIRYENVKCLLKVFDFIFHIFLLFGHLDNLEIVDKFRFLYYANLSELIKTYVYL